MDATMLADARSPPLQAKKQNLKWYTSLVSTFQETSIRNQAMS
jgi:hypothetical protein